MREHAQLLLESNQNIARLSMGKRYSLLDWKVIEARRQVCLESEKLNPWQVCKENFLLLPQLMPASEQIASHYSDLNRGLEVGAGIEQYIDVHGRDPHLLAPILQMREAVASVGFDVNNDVTTDERLSPYFLIAFATGDGQTLQRLINRYSPYHLFIAMHDWQDFATSFWSVDWARISREQKERGGKITIGCYKHGRDILGLLLNECHSGVDHALLYVPPEGSCSVQAKILRDQITTVDLSGSVSYLGYTVDEHNMVWNSWKTLSKSPRVFCHPQAPLGGKMIVCGSGPSLDTNLLALEELSRTHRITACGSNFRTLKAKGIRVDFLALVERADEVLEDVKEVVHEYGAGDTLLLMSTTCHSELLDLFSDGMVYFRPALTPLALFSNSPTEILNFEGPESINAGVAFASSIGVEELLLVGVDLGARSLEKIRSENAVGCTIRTLDLEEPGNFGGIVLTSSLLRDSRLSVEACLRHYTSVNAKNVSDGVDIKGAKACTMEAQLNHCKDVDSLSPFIYSSLGNWWNASQFYSTDRFSASWVSRRPRAEAASLIHQLKSLFDGDAPWNPVIMQEVTQLLSLDVPISVQFPRRVIRSTIHKLCIAANRQLIVMSADPPRSQLFEKKARKIIFDLLDLLEDELYSLCDAVESMPYNSSSSNSVSTEEILAHG